MYIAEYDASKMHFEKMTLGGSGQKQVLVYRDATSTSASNRLEFQLCADVAAPLDCKYRLDTVKDDGNPLRRGQKVKLTDAMTLAALRAIDEKIVATAIERSAEWFGKTLPAEQVRMRYKPIAEVRRDGDDHHEMKFTVKMPGGAVPTKLHLWEDGQVVPNAAQPEHLELSGAKVVPIVSAYSLYFLGGGTQFGLSFQAEKMIVTPGGPRDELSDFVSAAPLVAKRDAADYRPAKVAKLDDVELEDDYAAM
jgi:hypothetical protein